MKEHLAQQRKEIRKEHKQQIEAMNIVITERFAIQMATYKCHFRLLKGSTFVSSELKVTTERVVHDLGFPVRRIVRLSADST